MVTLRDAGKSWGYIYEDLGRCYSKRTLLRWYTKIRGPQKDLKEGAAANISTAEEV